MMSSPSDKSGYADYLRLPRPANPGEYALAASPHWYRAAKTQEGYPAVAAAFAIRSTAPTARRFELVTYHPPRPLRIVGDRGESTQEIAILECRTTDPSLIEYFYRLTLTFLEQEEASQSESSFEKALDSLAELFSALRKPGFRAVQGLWAELAAIAWARDPSTALTSWHSRPRALHDFASGDSRLEVKSTLKKMREHDFRLEQISTQQGGTTLVASIMLQERDDGASVFDLAEVIRSSASLAPDSSVRLEAVIAVSLGSAWRDADDVRFDFVAARRSLKLYRALEIPSVTQPLRPEVKDVRFTSDLSAVPELPLEEASTLSPLFRAVLPDPNALISLEKFGIHPRDVTPTG
jgi:hypothetical protein